MCSACSVFDVTEQATEFCIIGLAARCIMYSAASDIASLECSMAGCFKTDFGNGGYIDGCSISILWSS